MKWRIELARRAIDVEWIHVEVEADSRASAEALALKNHNDGNYNESWCDAKSEPVETESAYVDSIVEAA